MKLNTKIVFLITAALIFSAALSGLVSTWKIQLSGSETVAQIERLGRENIQRIKADGERQASTFKEELLALKREYLKSQVQTAIGVLEKGFTDAHDAQKLREVFRDQIQNAVNTAYGVIEAVAREDGLSLEAKQKKAAGLVKALRYGPENKDYFWINDMHPRMVMHPYKPEMDGQDLTESKDPNGKKLFVEFVNACRDKGEGFVDYMWPKYGADKPQPKLSFVKLFREWGWVIGTGLYIDDIDAVASARRNELDQRLQKASAEMDREIEAAKQDVLKSTRSVLAWIGGIMLAALAAVLVASFVFTRRSITRPIIRLVAGLNDGADQVASASSQISSTSQQLAEGASEQAASIEETSASLEEMASMTRQNADNAQQADHLMKETKRVVAQAKDSMSQMCRSMDDITKASEDTSKIIKTIDEIAFQTNLLALNAAVEAARAGQAGAGFAVVADEVRNLAMRAGDAARNTANLIEETVKKVKDGSALMSSTNNAFGQVSDSANKVADLVGEISAASGEQAQGIEQVNKAVSEMDKVTQQNAAHAEESASASEEMSAQAETMKAMVNELLTLVAGGVRKDANQPPKGVGKKLAAKIQRARRAANAKLQDKVKKQDLQKDKSKSPAEMIPLEDGDFKDF
jgi:methyl-accepting chemotaxis protein